MIKALKTVGELMTIDPEPDSDDGKYLNELVDVIQIYETKLS